MKWQIAKSTLRQEIYELLDKEKKLLTLEFHSATNSARIEYADEKRVFLIRKEGFLRSKIVLCNEYGIRLGYLMQDNKESYIELNSEKFFFDINKNPLPQLIIYKESKDHPLVTCELNVKNNTLSPNLYSSLLLALGWYIFLPVPRKQTAEYAM
jgi:hypothetical protein